MTPILPVHIVLFAKPALPGRCKSRLIGPFSPEQAALIHGAMTQCLIDRLTCMFSAEPVGLVLAIDGAAGLPGAPCTPGDMDREWGFKCGLDWGLQPQGSGGLGERIVRVWRSLGEDRPAVLLGSDAADVPEEAIRLAVAVACQGGSRLALGPASDGGYWTLGAGRLWPSLFEHIDWGGPSVYHQTQLAGGRQGLVTQVLPQWDDVDRPADLSGLLKRLVGATDPHLQKLGRQLALILKDHP